MNGTNIASLVEIHTVAGLLDGGGDGLEVFTVDTAECHTLPRDGGGGHEGARFDPVWDDRVFHSVKFFYALDDDAASASTIDFCAHRVKEIC